MVMRQIVMLALLCAAAAQGQTWQPQARGLACCEARPVSVQPYASPWARPSARDRWTAADRCQDQPKRGDSLLDRRRGWYVPTPWQPGAEGYGERLRARRNRQLLTVPGQPITGLKARLPLYSGAGWRNRRGYVYGRYGAGEPRRSWGVDGRVKRLLDYGWQR